ncbi:hypothetical protein H6P81_018558 [Aristolochia fimbriata]|uniref:PLATZ transcription factor family protein n=1 Tax=Aristolochia fimbriata TaxID=158543 RepID=A0AAV7E3D9_ARIFI|nr:hypothetical protein H6P81_018558 [Aristolochia fimbriata]
MEDSTTTTTTTTMAAAAATLVPPWLESLLSTPFFSICQAHGDATRSECNMYCLDCAGGDAFCYYCRANRHNTHRVIQIRRSSYHDVVRVSEIQSLLDIGGVQTYVINSARVLFLNERPQPKTAKGVAHACEICGRSLLDPFRFCSLGCKLVGIRRNGEGSLVGEKGISELREGAEHGIFHCTSPLPLPPTTSNARRRKGVPHRAPLRS